MTTFHTRIIHVTYTWSDMVEVFTVHTMVIQLCKFILIFTLFDIQSAPWNAKHPKWFGTKKKIRIYSMCVLARVSTSCRFITYSPICTCWLYLVNILKPSEYKKTTRSNTNEKHCIQMCIFFRFVYILKGQCALKYHIIYLNFHHLSYSLRLEYFDCFAGGFFSSHHKNEFAPSENVLGK